MYQKRFIVCIIGGIISAFICILGGSIRGAFTTISLTVLAISANRLLIGFVIGISGWRINYLLHGAIIGLIISITTSIKFLPDDMISFVLYTCAGVVYGLLTEFLSTVVFKAPMKSGPPNEPV